TSLCFVMFFSLFFSLLFWFSSRLGDWEGVKGRRRSPPPPTAHLFVESSPFFSVHLCFLSVYHSFVFLCSPPAPHPKWK
ncbi:uncharacterized protein EV422DRAFT_546292, partial [Fimicolochytrium jonesii]|uniref:uncharacterized protein n=1 Tax=Fimicolochytrium jonesii TaxID=1396493 RepID=UPI0022FE2F91